MAKPKSIRLLKKLYGGNILSRLGENEFDARNEAAREVKAVRISDISQELGEFTGFALTARSEASESSDPTDSGFVGWFARGDPITFDNGVVANSGTAKAGVPAVVMNTDGDLLYGNGVIRGNETGLDIGPGKLFLGADGVLGDGGNIFLDTTNFDEVLSLTGSGGYSALATGVAAGAVYCMVKLGTDIYIGGSFLQAGGVRSPYFAKWDGSAWSKPYVGELNGAVLTMVVVGTDIYLGGVFTKNYTSGTTGGASSTTPALVSGDSGGSGAYELLNYIGKYNGTTVLGLNYLTSYGASAAVRALAVNGTTLYAGGDFTTMLGTSATRVCSIDTTGPTASALSTGLDGTCYSLIYSTDLYAGGAFTGKVKRYNAGSWSTWGTSGPNGTVYALTRWAANDIVYAVGDFTSPASYIGKTTAGGAWATVASLAGVGYAIAIDGGTKIVGFAGGENAKYFVGLGETEASLGAGVNSSVYSVLVDTNYLVGGIFTQADGNIMYRIARYSIPSGAQPTEITLQDMAEIIDGHGHYSTLGGQIGGTIAAGATRYGSIFNVGVGTEADIAVPLSAGTLYGLRVYMSSTQPATGSLVLTIRKNGNDTAVVLTIPANSGANEYSVATTVAFVDDDKFTLKIVNNASTASGSLSGFSTLHKVNNL